MNKSIRNKSIRYPSTTLSFAITLAGVMYSTPMYAAQLNFDRSSADSKVTTPDPTSHCAHTPAPNLTSRTFSNSAQTLELGPNLRADNIAIANDARGFKSEPTLVAQEFVDDCCVVGDTAIGGAAFEDAALCGLGGVPPAGGVTPGGFPFPALAALAPAAAVPFVVSGGEPEPSPPPTPTPPVPPTPPSTPPPTPTPPPPVPPTRPPEQVPEPSTMAGILIGGAVFGIYKRRKKLKG